MTTPRLSHPQFQPTSKSFVSNPSLLTQIIFQLLVSSLSRRVFTTEHNATDGLANERRAAGIAAEETDSPFINLSQASLDYINAIGKTAAWTYNGPNSATDRTHLNLWGEVVFGRFVADLVVRELPYLRRFVTKNETMSDLIWNGLPA